MQPADIVEIMLMCRSALCTLHSRWTRAYDIFYDA